MINIIVVSHGNLADALIETARMVAGTVDSVYAVSLLPNDTPDIFSNKLNSILSVLQERETLILIDMFSGTPSNIAAGLVLNENIECVTGVNLPMLLEAILTREGISVHELAGYLSETGIHSIKNLKTLLK